MVRPDQHVVFVGLMGSGKSTVSRLLAERLQRPLYDTDHMIEARTGRTVREIFTEDGESAFRALEAEVFAEALHGATPAVIAAAGGVVLSAENRQMLHDQPVRVVWLRADPGVLAERVKLGAHRPLLDADPASALQTMAEDREPFYREVADVIITVDGRSVNDVVEAVLR
jgi:shikimate kinase